MATAILAIADERLREACRGQLQAAGHVPVRLKRSMELLSLAKRLRWDLVCLDNSAIGRDVLALHAPNLSSAPLVGVGIEAPALAGFIPLPFVAERLLTTLRSVLPPPIREAAPRGPVLRLDPIRRLAGADGQSVQLTRTEFRLLELLVSRNAVDVSLPEVLETVWGTTEGIGSADLVRSHVRNLRRKLARLGLADAVRSRRGLGYAFVP